MIFSYKTKTRIQPTANSISEEKSNEVVAQLHINKLELFNVEPERITIAHNMNQRGEVAQAAEGRSNVVWHGFAFINTI